MGASLFSMQLLWLTRGKVGVFFVLCPSAAPGVNGFAGVWVLTGALQQPCLITLGVHGGRVGISTSCLVRLAVLACEAELACEAIAALMNATHEEDDPELEDDSEDVVE